MGSSRYLSAPSGKPPPDPRHRTHRCGRGARLAGESGLTVGPQTRHRTRHAQPQASRQCTRPAGTRLLDALAQCSRDPPHNALDDACRKRTRLGGGTPGDPPSCLPPIAAHAPAPAAPLALLPDQPVQLVGHIPRHIRPNRPRTTCPTSNERKQRPHPRHRLPRPENPPRPIQLKQRPQLKFRPTHDGLWRKSSGRRAPTYGFCSIRVGSGSNVAKSGKRHQARLSYEGDSDRPRAGKPSRPVLQTFRWGIHAEARPSRRACLQGQAHGVSRLSNRPGGHRRGASSWSVYGARASSPDPVDDDHRSSHARGVRQHGICLCVSREMTRTSFPSNQTP